MGKEMTLEAIKAWLKYKYPVTIVSDRYDGAYSEAEWLAFPLEYDEVPDEVNAGDGTSLHFWENYTEPVGKGNTPTDAYINLIRKMKQKI